MMRTKSFYLLGSLRLIFYSVSLMFLNAACDNEDEKEFGLNDTLYGQQVAVGNGYAKTYVSTTDGKPEEIGIILSKDGLSGLPHEDHTVFVLPLPDHNINQYFKHVTLDWENHGHDPAGVYDIPHFDFHFYMITNEERLAISPDDPKMEIEPEGKFIPEDYFPTPGVPQMGKHWLDGASPEWNGKKFTTTFIYGSYDGKVSFLEPMITREFLETNSDFSEKIKQPDAFDKTGFFPKNYSIRYNESTEEYLISLKDLTFQSTD